MRVRYFNLVHLMAFSLFLQAPELLGQPLLQDNFMQDSSLNQTLWSTDASVLQAAAQKLGTPVPPQISFPARE